MSEEQISQSCGHNKPILHQSQSNYKVDLSFASLLMKYENYYIKGEFR